MQTEKMKVVLVDDSLTFTNAVKSILPKILDCQIIGVLRNGKDFMEHENLIRKADIVLMDIEMPDLNGIDCTKSWCLKNPQTKIIAVTMYTEKAYLKQLIEAGCKGCVFKNDFFSHIVKAIHEVMNKGMYFPDDINL